MKRAFLVLQFVALLLYGVGGFAVAEPVRLNFAFAPRIKGTPDGEAAQKLLDILDKSMKEKLEVSLYDGGKLGSELQVLRRMQNGEPIVGFIGDQVLSNIDSSFFLLGLPFAFSSSEQLQRILHGPVGEELTRRLLAKGFRILDWWDIGFTVMGTRKGPIHSLEDLKGLRIRTGETSIFADELKFFGGMPVELSIKDIFSALKTGELDGFWIAGLGFAYHNKLDSYAPNFYLGHLYHVTRPVIIAESVWQKLPKDVQDGLMNALKAVSAQQWESVRKAQEILKKKLKARGARIVEFTKEEDARAKQKLQPIWKKYAPLIGEDLVRKLENSR